MRPLPPFTVRPLKRREEPKQVTPTASVKELAGTMADEMSIRSGRLSVRTASARERPRLRVLERG